MIKKQVFDKDNNVWLYELSNDKLKVGVTDYGGIIQYVKLVTPQGEKNICLGFDNIADYVDSGSYCGAIVGRVANRIKDARFSYNGATYQLTANEGNNHLHGGFVGFDKRFFTVEVVDEALRLSLVSPSGEEGYPGELHFTALLQLDDNALDVRYSAYVTDSEFTLWNPTCHLCFNLNGTGDVLGHLLTINASHYTPVDSQLVPTGVIASVSGTPFDFTSPKAIGKHIFCDDEQLTFANGYDHNFVLDGNRAVSAVGDVSGIRLDMFTDMPGLHLYTGNGLKGNGNSGELFPRQGFCIEPQYFPNAINTDGFLSPILLRGETKSYYIRYEFSLTDTER